MISVYQLDKRRQKFQIHKKGLTESPPAHHILTYPLISEPCCWPRIKFWVVKGISFNCTGNSQHYFLVCWPFLEQLRSHVSVKMPHFSHFSTFFRCFLILHIADGIRCSIRDESNRIQSNWIELNWLIQRVAFHLLKIFFFLYHCFLWYFCFEISHTFYSRKTIKKGSSWFMTRLDYCLIVFSIDINFNIHFNIQIRKCLIA